MSAVAHFSWTGWRANKNFFLVMALYVLAALSSSVYWKIAIDMQLYSDAFLLFGFGVTVILFAVISIRVMLERPPRIYPALRDRLTVHRLPERLVVGLPVAVGLPIFFSLFTSMKGGISRIVPFYADNTLIAVDRAIHGGMDAWQILHPLLGAGLVTLALNFLYNLWFIVMIVILFCVVFSAGNERLRSQYLVAFVLAWALLGNVAAALFSSVGPAFLAAFYSDDSFEPLMSYLRSTDATYPVWALDAQGMLLANAGLDGPRLGSGISAFPSMHVAVATLNAIYLWRFGSLLRWTSIVFLIAIQVAAVHLAWHYAIDGYASMLATPVIWAFAGWMSDIGQQQRGRPVAAS
ncbi:MAG: inositol phosphorylceramide synthase [Mesorhizobium sp.]|nr:MAG: inositol phosphorylceramide synthase [Mesorhizobium sp.]